MRRLLSRLSRRLKGFSHQQTLVRLRNVADFTPLVIYDIGAYHGTWTLDARKIFPAAQYFLFEANPDNAPVLQASGERYFIAALARDERQAAFYVPKSDIPATGASLYREQTAHYLGERARVVELTTRRLDTLATEHDLPSPDLVKLDVQGAELDVLRGAGSLLHTCSALIAEVSLLRGNEGAPVAAEVIAGINDHGFKCVDICKIRRTAVGSVGQLDLLFVNTTLYAKFRTAADLTDL